MRTVLSLVSVTYLVLLSWYFCATGSAQTVAPATAASTTTSSPTPTVALVKAVPDIPKVFGAEVEMNQYNGTDHSSGSSTFTFYEQFDFNRNLTKAIFRYEGSRGVSEMDEVLLTDWNTMETHIIWEGRCSIPHTPSGAAAERFTLSELLFMVDHPMVTYLGSDTVRGIDAEVWEVKNLPLDKGGGITGVVSLKWAFSVSTWKYWGSESGARLLDVSLSGLVYGGWNTTDVHFSMSIVDISPSRAWSDDAFDLPAVCSDEEINEEANSTTSSGVDVTTAAPPLEEMNPMPTLPESWSAVVETNMKELQQTFTTYEWFSQPDAMAHTTWVLPIMDFFDRQLKHDIYVFGDFQIAYQSTEDAVPEGYTSSFNPSERAMFYPDTYSCSKNVFNQNLVGSTDDVLLKSAAPRARYMGTTSVRGIKAQYWQSANSEYKVQWYFADQDWPYSSSNGTVLLRMSIVGQGRAPLFVHHPFLQTYSTVPSSMSEACQLFMDGNLEYCDSDAVYYEHVHDFIGFSDFVVTSDFTLPDWCLDESSSINSVPASANCPSGGMDDGEVIFLMILVAVFTALATSVFWSVRHKRSMSRSVVPNVHPQHAEIRGNPSTVGNRME